MLETVTDMFDLQASPYNSQKCNYLFKCIVTCNTIHYTNFVFENMNMCKYLQHADNEEH
jgi:hypothetical protein